MPYKCDVESDDAKLFLQFNSTYAHIKCLLEVLIVMVYRYFAAVHAYMYVLFLCKST